MSRTRRSLHWIALGLMAALAMPLLTGAGAARANSLTTITIPALGGGIPSSSLTYSGPPRADVRLPTGYNPKRAYPLILLLPGFTNTYTILGPSMLDAQQVLSGLQAIVISPEGESGWYMDWYNNGRHGAPEWESYILDEVIPQILAR
jgi:S-formylglutathione hydrolase FrmB